MQLLKQWLSDCLNVINNKYWEFHVTIAFVCWPIETENFYLDRRKALNVLKDVLLFKKSEKFMGN